MKIFASSSSSSSTFRTCLLFFVREGPLSGLLFFLAVLMEVTLSCDHSSSSCTGLGRDRVFFLGLASSWSSSSSVCGRAVMPLTSKDVRRLLEVEPLSVEVEGRGTRLLDVDGPADDSPLLGFGCARVLRDLLGRCSCVVVLLLLQVCRRIPIVRCSFDRAPPHEYLVDEILHHILKCWISLELFGGWSSDAALGEDVRIMHETINHQDVN